MELNAKNWFFEVLGDKQAFGLKVTKELYRETSEYQEIMIFENENFGTVLTLDGTYQLSDLDEHMYHSALTRYGMQNVLANDDAQNPSAKDAQGQGLRILVLGGGDGGIVRDLLNNWDSSISKVTMVEIDQKVIDASKKFFPQIASAFTNPKLELLTQDAIQYIKDAPVAEFDLVLCDSTDPVGFAAGLIEEDFYKTIKRILKPQGIYCCQSGSPIFQQTEHNKCKSNLAKVFTEVQTYYAPMIVYPGTIWSYTAAGAKILNRSNIDIGDFIEASAKSINSRPQLQPS